MPASNEQRSAESDEDANDNFFENGDSASDIDVEESMEIESEYESDCTDDDEVDPPNQLMFKDGTEWMATPFRSSQTISRNILRERQGLAGNTTNLSTIKTFNTILSKEICCTIVRETNRKGKAATALYNAKEFIPFTVEEYHAF